MTEDLAEWDAEFAERTGFAPDGGLATAVARMNTLASSYNTIWVHYDDNNALWTVGLNRAATRGGPEQCSVIVHHHSLDAALTQATREIEQ